MCAIDVTCNMCFGFTPAVYKLLLYPYYHWNGGCMRVHTILQSAAGGLPKLRFPLCSCTDGTRTAFLNWILTIVLYSLSQRFCVCLQNALNQIHSETHSDFSVVSTIAYFNCFTTVVLFARAGNGGRPPPSLRRRTDCSGSCFPAG